MNQSSMIVEEWNKVDNGSLNDVTDQIEIRRIKGSMYDEIEKNLNGQLSNQKNPRATIRRAVNSKIFGWKPKKTNSTN